VHCYVLVTTDSTTIRLRFDGHSTAYQRSLRSQWRNPLVTLPTTTICLGSSSQEVGLRSNCRGMSRTAVQSQCNRSCNHRFMLTDCDVIDYGGGCEAQILSHRFCHREGTCVRQELDWRCLPAPQSSPASSVLALSLFRPVLRLLIHSYQRQCLPCCYSVCCTAQEGD